jgi:hypothetical protein
MLSDDETAREEACLHVVTYLRRDGLSNMLQKTKTEAISLTGPSENKNENE